MATNSQVVKTITIQLNTKDSKIKIDGITKGFVEAGEAAQNFSAKASQGFDALATGANNARSATGSASATVLEAGRVVSDFNYGIRGVANNLSQFANNLIFTTEKAGGFMAGLKDIWSALMGPLGILLAINVVIAAIERFAMESEKASKSSDDLSDSLRQEINVLSLYEATLRDVNTTLEERTAIVRGLSALDKNLAKQLKEAGDDQQKLADITKKVIQQKEIEAEIKQKEIELNEAIIETGEKQQDVDERQIRLDAKRDDEGYIVNAERRKDVQEDQADALVELNEAQTSQKKILDELLQLYLKLNPEEEKNTNNIRSFKQKYLDLSKVISGFERREEMGSEKNEARKLEIKQRFERQDLELRKKMFLEKEQLRLDDFLASNANEEQKALAQKRFNETERKAEADHQKALTELTLAQTTEMFNFKYEKLQEYNDRVREAIDAGEIQDLTFAAGRDTGVDALEAQQQFLEAEFNQKLYYINRDIEARKAAGEDYMDLEIQKRNATKQFNNESLDITEKTEKAKRAVVALGFQAIAQIAGEGSRVGKLASAAAAVMSTYEAVNSALGAKPYGPWNIAQAAIVAAMGFANVKSILQTPIPTGNGTQTTTGGEGGRTFDFNLAGTTGVNQLAGAIGGQFQEPIQAYVVSSQITSQQELDLQIQTGASLGD